MPVSDHYTPDPRWLELGDGFHDAVQAASFPEHRLRVWNTPWAERIGLGALTDAEREAHLARFTPLPDNLSEPLALRYHGHQFTTYNPALGDGRGFLFAQLRDPVDGRLLDLGTKGSGTTPYSRGGDGRLTLKGGVREVLAAELLAARGVETCKILSLYETGESLTRYDEPSPTRSCAMVRLSHSHVRFGTFQRHAWAKDAPRLMKLLGYCGAHLTHEIADAADPALALVDACARRSAETAAGWLVAGFVHGVLNTDNMNVTGESFDYGPWRFLPAFDPGFVAAYFDHSGLYAFGRQPDAVFWNLQQLAWCLRFVGEKDALLAAVERFGEYFPAAFQRRFAEALGVERDEGTGALLQSAYAGMHATRIPYDRLFYDWHGGPASADRALAGPHGADYDAPAFADFRRAVADATPDPAAVERLEAPYFQRGAPEGMLIDEVEAIWERIDRDDDWSALDAKIQSIRDVGELFGRGA